MTELLVIARGIHFAATVLVAGVAFFRFFVAEPAFRKASGDAIDAWRASWARTAWIALVVAVLSAAAWLVLLAANIYGETVFAVCAQGGIFTVAADTRFGQIWCARFVLALLLGVLMVRPPARPRFRNIVSLILATVVLASLAWIGHAGATPGTDGDIHLTSDVLHLLAAGAWVGGLPPLIMLLARAHGGDRTLTAVVPLAVSRFSALGIVCVGTLLMTGIINARYLVVTLANLFGTDYGRLVLVKIGLFAAMIGIAAVNKFYLTPRLAKGGAARRLARNSLIELGLGTVVVLVVGLLGTMPPAGHTHAHATYGPVSADAAFVHIHSADGMADVTMTPGRAGTSRATIRLWHEDLTELAAKAVIFSLTPPAERSKPLVRTARQLTDGSWEVDGIRLPEGGNWMVNVEAQLLPTGRLELDAPIVIEP